MIKLQRDRGPVEGQAFVAMPYGEKPLADGHMFDFDQHYDEVLARAIRNAGMVPVRADSIYGPAGVIDAIWRGIQEADVVVVDFTSKSPNVALEYGIAEVLGKRIVLLTMQPEDIPSDLQGQRYIRYDGRSAPSCYRMSDELKMALDAVRREPPTEMTLIPMKGVTTESVPARVVSVESDFVTVRLEDGSGRHAVLLAQDVTYSRLIRDMHAQFEIGQRVDGAIESDGKGGVKYTLVAGTKNPWPDVSLRYVPGSVFRGFVNNVTEFGVFVELSDGINGLIPSQLIPAHVRLSRGDEVEAVVATLDSEKRRISLRLRSGPETAPWGGKESAVATPTTAVAPSSQVGDQIEGVVDRVVPERGFALVKLSNGDRGILHISKMTEELKEDFVNRELLPGDELFVEVVAVDTRRSRVDLADVSESEEAEVAA